MMMATTNETSTSGNVHGSQPPGANHFRSQQDDSRTPPQGATEQAGAQFDQYRDGAAQTLEDLASNAQSAIHKVDGNDTLGVSRYVNDIAHGINTLADNLRNRSAEQLLQDAGRLAKENPVLFLSASVAIGLGLSRLMKATGASSDTSSDTSTNTSNGPSSAVASSASSTASAGAATAGAPGFSTENDLSAGDSSQPYDPISPAVLATEEMAATHPHDEHSTHNARPGNGVSDIPAMNEFNDDMDGDLSRDGLPRSGLPRGDV